jgi:hypothetical protein
MNPETLVIIVALVALYFKGLFHTEGIWGAIVFVFVCLLGGLFWVWYKNTNIER